MMDKWEIHDVGSNNLHMIRLHISKIYDKLHNELNVMWQVAKRMRLAQGQRE
jgi:hypothetical protein